MSTGIDNRNWMNIKAPHASYWNGQIGIDDRNHAQFRSPAYSIRAGLRQLRTYQKNYGIDTFKGIFERWAPATDTVGSIAGNAANNPIKYAKFVAKAVDAGPNAKTELFNADWSLTDEERACKIMKAIARYEGGPEFKSIPKNDLIVSIGVYLYNAGFDKDTGDIVEGVIG